MYSKIINEVDVHLLGGCTLNIDEENRTKEKIMSLQAIRVAPGQVETVGSDRETHDDLGYRGTNRGSEVTYPVSLSFRVLHWFFIGSVVSIIVMLMLGL